MSNKGKYFVTRIVEFAAAHRLYREEYTETKNLQLFGPCANPYGHGHNYILECTFEGLRQSDTAMVVHFGSLKALLQEMVIAPLDHRHLNHDVPFLQEVLPTSENLVTVLWERISGALANEPFRLHKLRLASSTRNWVEYYGPEN